MKLDHYLTPYTNINSKWIKDLSVRPEAIKNKIPRQNIVNNLIDTVIRNVFVVLTSNTRETKAKINGMTSNKIVLHIKRNYQQN